MKKNTFEQSKKRADRELVGLGEFCNYLIKFLKEESRYGTESKRYKKYYKLASQYPNNKEKINRAFNGYYKPSMTYGLESSILLERIISTVLTEEEKANAIKKLDYLKNNNISFIEYYQSNNNYDLNVDLFEQLSLEDAYVFYENRKYIISKSKEEIDRTIEYTQKMAAEGYTEPEIIHVFYK